MTSPITLSRLDVQDVQYRHMLAHLQNSQSTLSITAIEATLSHYLARLDIQHVSPLAATALLSHFWNPPSVARCSSLSQIFQNAVHIKSKMLLEAKSTSWLPISSSVDVQFKSWISATLKGLTDSHFYVRAAAQGGILRAISELSDPDVHRESLVQKPEEELAVALAEATEFYKLLLHSQANWSQEYSSTHEDLLLITVAVNVSRLSSRRLKILDLPTIIEMLFIALDRGFESGDFLKPLRRDVVDSYSHQHLLSDPAGAPTQKLTTTYLFDRVPHTSRALAQSLALFINIQGNKSRVLVGSILQKIQKLASTVESDWKLSPEILLKDEKGLPSSALEVKTNIWAILKSLLFSTVMVNQSVQTALIFSRKYVSLELAALCSRLCLQTLNCLAFVISQVGGIGADSPFVELKKCYFTALDALHTDRQSCVAFAKEICQDAETSLQDLGVSFNRVKLAFCLVTMEHLLPMLDERQIEELILPSSLPVLNAPEYREIFEPAHSVVLSILGLRSERETSPSAKPSLSERLVPAYCRHLLVGSKKHALSEEQMGLASKNLFVAARRAEKEPAALTWHCIQEFINAERDISSQSVQDSDNNLHLARMQMALIVAVGSVPSIVLPRLLTEIGAMLKRVEKQPVIEGHLSILWKQIMNNVADNDRPFCLDWWDGLLVSLRSQPGSSSERRLS